MDTNTLYRHLYVKEYVTDYKQEFQVIQRVDTAYCVESLSPQEKETYDTDPQYRDYLHRRMEAGIYKLWRDKYHDGNTVLGEIKYEYFERPALQLRVYDKPGIEVEIKASAEVFVVINIEVLPIKGVMKVSRVDKDIDKETEVKRR